MFAYLYPRMCILWYVAICVYVFKCTSTTLKCSSFCWPMRPSVTSTSKLRLVLLFCGPFCFCLSGGKALIYCPCASASTALFTRQIFDLSLTADSWQPSWPILSIITIDRQPLIHLALNYRPFKSDPPHGIASYNKGFHYKCEKKAL